jgi:flavodoxin
MKIYIIYHSEHHGNTEKIARTIGSFLKAETVSSQKADIGKILEYELVGFGSGIYHGKFHDNLYSIVDRLPAMQGKKSFLFSTTGSKTYSVRGHDLFKVKLKEKGFQVIGEFSCLGFDTALSSEGINRGRPNAEDLREAETFARSLHR